MSMVLKSDNDSTFLQKWILKLVSAHALWACVEDSCGIFDLGTLIFEKNSNTYYNSVCLIYFNAILKFIFRTIGGKSIRKFQKNK